MAAAPALLLLLLLLLLLAVLPLRLSVPLMLMARPLQPLQQGCLGWARARCPFPSRPGARAHPGLLLPHPWRRSLQQQQQQQQQQQLLQLPPPPLPCELPQRLLQ